jgi:acyl carrier protein
MRSVDSESILLDEEMVEEKNYWMAAVAGLTAEPLLPTDHPRPPENSGETDSLEVEVPPDVYLELKSLTSENSFLLYTSLLAALQICLSKYSGRRRVCVGSPARRYDLNPYQPDNALAIVCDVDDLLSFREHLLNVRQVLLDSYARQLYPFERLVRDLCLENVKNKCPLFDVALILTDIHTGLPAVGNDITFTFSKAADRLPGRVTFNPELFEARSIRLLADSFIRCLRSALKDKNKLVRDVQITPEAEASPSFNCTDTRHTARRDGPHPNGSDLARTQTQQLRTATARQGEEGRPMVSERVAPRTEVERMIAEIWREVLAVDEVGVEDNFFDVGGTSLQMAEAFSRLQASVGKDFSQLEMFKYPTVAALAGFLGDQGVEELLSARGHDRGGVRRAARTRRQKVGERKR